ncbi:unnamed protein product [Owenia fusiformis]|nr:unnamed protein product [Owenia fusiformis]
MGTLLKSLFCITRVTPSYRLSRKQGPDTFIICYRVYTGEPQFEHLGEGYNSIKVGTVATPMGTITISGAYRTKLLISPQTISKDLSNELKDDHFNTDCSPRRYSPKPCVGGYRDRRPSIDSIVSESDMCATTFSNSPSHTSSDVSTPEHPTSKPINIQQTPSDTRLHEKAQLCVPEKPVLTLSQGQKQGAFAPQTHTSTPPRDSTDDIPFMSLLHYSQAIETPEITTNNTNSNRPLDTTAKNTYHEKTKSESDSKSEHLDVDAISSSTESKGSSKSENKSCAADDFVMVELKAPFAGREMQSDLGRFYRDCQTAPQLEMFQEPPNIDVALNQISDQLAAFESNLDDIDSFVDSVISLEDA